jgi:hypothetical protein
LESAVLQFLHSAQKKSKQNKMIDFRKVLFVLHMELSVYVGWNKSGRGYVKRGDSKNKRSNFETNFQNVHISRRPWAIDETNQAVDFRSRIASSRVRRFLGNDEIEKDRFSSSSSRK